MTSTHNSKLSKSRASATTEANSAKRAKTTETLPELDEARSGENRVNLKRIEKITVEGINDLTLTKTPEEAIVHIDWLIGYVKEHVASDKKRAKYLSVLNEIRANALEMIESKISKK